LRPARSRPARIRDVAQRAGVSVATVSRTLNGDARVDGEMRARVIAASQDLKYRPNRLARNLRRQKLDAIGVVVSDIENPHFAETVRVIEEAALGYGFKILVCNTDESSDKEADYIQILTDERVSGIIISPASPAADLTHPISVGIPVVAIDREVHNPKTDAVLPDNVGALRIATRRLIDAGHRAIAFVGGRAEVETGSERQEGYLQAMKAAGLPAVITSGGFRLEPARSAVGELMKSRRRPTALVVANNLMALGALHALRDAGAEVPADVAMISVDNPPWAELVDPPLTVLAQPIRRIATRSVELLMERIRSTPALVSREVVPLDLILRESCGTRATTSRAPSSATR
jgi:LacI family transcriptional regulator